MLVLMAVLLALIPTVAILYPFVRRLDALSVLDDEDSRHSELAGRWEVAVGGLKDAELERAVGTLTEDDYRWLKERYMTEAALVMKALELEDRQREELLASVEREVREVGRRVLGEDEATSGEGGRGD